MRGESIRAIVYLPLDPDKAKQNNLPVKLPVLAEDLPRIVEEDRIPLDVVLRGLEAQYEVSKDEYYRSYYVFFLYEKFKELLREQKLDEAEKVLEKAKEVQYDYRYHFYRGLLLKHKEDLGEAEVEMRVAISMKEDFAPAYFELANILKEKGETEDSILFYEKAYETNKEFLLPLLKKGDLLLEEGRFEEALEEYKRILEKDPNFTEVYERLGVIHNQLQRFKEAEKFFRRALEVERKDHVEFNLSYTLIKLGRLFEALGILKRLYEKIPDDPMLANEYGLLLKTLGLYEEALEVFEGAYSRHKDEEILKYNYATILLHFDKEKAISALSEITGELKERAEHMIALAENEVSVPSLEEFEWLRDYFYEGTIDVVSLAEDLVSSNEEVQKRIEILREGQFPFYDTTIDTSEMIETMMGVIFESPDIFKMEENIVKFSSAFFGSSIMIASSLVLLRIVQFLLVFEDLLMDDLLKELVAETQDINWRFSLRIARFRHADKFNFERLSDLTIALLQSLEQGVPVAADDRLEYVMEKLHVKEG
ncbi:tetratricopeptide repeat protein [Thermotoga sp.]|uniref:tetratricopeptide repeat protein n=1 Tax=Thermotoga sp. TaxID=28240 RepID=UPI0025EC2AB3|nr:tetratricopeptide repeat protein [Thermotoga sp.]MCD6551167.1 tetratricopeptide repeat protein [Thermotoga sp.]